MVLWGEEFRCTLASKKFAPTEKEKTDKNLERNSESFFFRFSLIFIDILCKVTFDIKPDYRA